MDTATVSDGGRRTPVDNSGLTQKESRLGDLFLPALPSCIADFCDEMIEDDNSVWSRSTRIASFSWDWDEPTSSPSSLRARPTVDSGHSKSTMGASTPMAYCRCTSIQFAPGESARAEYSSPQSPRFFLASRPFDVSGDELEALLEGIDGREDSEIVEQHDEPVRRPVAPRGAGAGSTEQTREVITPLDLTEGEYDFQGIPWPRFSISRSEYRMKRVREYSNYNNVNWNAQLEMQRRADISKVGKVSDNIFEFYETFKSINPTIDHFQLRHLLWSSSAVTSYYVSNSVLYEFNKKTRVSRRVQAANAQQMACCHVDHGLAVTGAFDSEVKVSRILDKSNSVVTRKLSHEPNSITNHVAATSSSRVVAANNDSFVTELDVGQGALTPVTRYKWSTAVNHVSVSPGSSILCLAGDTCEVSLVDRRSQAEVSKLSGHLDYSFCSSWCGDNVICTGSQDGTCRVWDVRRPDQSLACLGSLLGAVRCAKFSSDGRYLAFSEPADFVHIYDVSSGLKECQVLDFFGNISGLAFSPDSSKLSVSLADTMFGCLIDFQVGSLPLNTTKRQIL